ncbi:MAG: hypothetical protein EA426_19675 [Spirochaetaceae bacterium]|nr:MAG: hypothetical protein EA426_19675 [Spirochaetaceae bacterium]
MGLIGTALWVFFCYLVGKGAKNQNRNFWVWFAISFFLSPIIGFVGITLLPRRPPSGYIE